MECRNKQTETTRKITGINKMLQPYEIEEMKPDQKAKSVYNLTVELRDAKRAKNTHAKAYREEIKRIQSEIDDLTKDDLTLEVI